MKNNSDKIIEILNGIREIYEMEFSECEYAKECESCKECFAYEAAQALGYAINAVKFKEKYRAKG